MRSRLEPRGLSVTPSAVVAVQQWPVGRGIGLERSERGVLVALPLGRHADASASVNYSRSLNEDWFPSKAWGGLTVTVY